MKALPRPAGDVVLVADVHIGPEDPGLDDFLAFLRERAGDTATLVLLGDIFTLWLGRPKFTADHHHAVLDACRELRSEGVEVVFVEGNREFSAGVWEGDAFDRVSDRHAVECWGDRRWYLAHGDLLNRQDRANRLFRAVVRSGPVQRAFGLLTPRAGARLAARIERSLRHRNLAHKTSIPPERFAGYARWLARQGFDAGVIGHLHVEMAHQLVGDDGRVRRLFVLPDWRSGHRYLRIPPQAAPRFEAWRGAAAPAPAVVEVRRLAEGRVALTFDGPTGCGEGERIVVDSGHGPGGRVGRICAAEAESRRLVVELEPGPPLQVGDRLERSGDAE